MDVGDINSLIAGLKTATPTEKRKLLELLEELEKARDVEKARKDFLAYVSYMWPGFIGGRHHKIMADAFERIISGESKRIIVNMAPRHTKSEFASIYLPSWFLGKFPEKKIIKATHTAELAVGFGRKVRSIVDSEDFQDVFPGVHLSPDSKAAGRWSTNKKGEYFAIGVGGAVAGRGADLLVIDDPIDEQTAQFGETNPEIYNKNYEWYTLLRQRLQPKAAIIIVMCMTGDTPVLMADSREVALRDIRPGDRIATYETERITESVVKNWKSNGFDDVLIVKTQSGRTVRANARHPFLVDFDGKKEWVRLQDLKVGMALVSTSGVLAPQELEPNRAFDVTTDIITEIIPSGREEVFDIEVDRTGNFIANGIVSHNTRWSKRDLTGRLLNEMQNNPKADQWEIIELPAIMPSGEPMWPEYWPIEDLLKTKESIPVHRWNAQYQQTPTSEEAALIKRSYWKRWESTQPPSCNSILVSWDTAFEKTERADYSACTIWGIFNHPDESGIGRDNLILLDAVKGKWEFPELKKKVKEIWEERDPDMMVIEKKAAGAPLIYELRSMGIPVQSFTPVRGNDKIARVNAVTDLFASGMVWAPETRFAEEVIEECAEFPAGDHDDYVDSVSQALLRFSQGGLIRTPSDYDDENEIFIPKKRAYY